MSSGDRPDARELIDAVAIWLVNELAPALGGGARFQALIAAQALATAGRELDLTAEHDAADVATLGPLSGTAAAGDAEAVRRALADELRAGKHDGDLGAVGAVLREHVARKLAVARPGYDSA